MTQDSDPTKWTLSDVAAKAGVSRSLASLALRGTEKVAPEKRRRVLEAAAELNYVVNPIARKLASAENRTIAVVAGDILNPFQASLTKAIDSAAASQGFEVILSIHGSPDSESEQAIDTLVARRVAGLILIDALSDEKALERIAWQVPVVYVGRQLMSERVDCISNDDRLGATLLVRHLFEQGHKIVGHIDGGHGAGAESRRQGFITASERFGLTPHVVSGRYAIDEGAKGAEALLRAAPGLTAIFAPNDYAAFGVLSYLAKRGVKVPSEIAVVGYDDMPLAGADTMSLTTMRQPIDDMAQQAVEALKRRLLDPAAAAVRMLVSPSLVVRGTTQSEHSKKSSASKA